jgi:cytochrome c oxidase subunit 2
MATRSRHRWQGPVAGLVAGAVVLAALAGCQAPMTTEPMTTIAPKSDFGWVIQHIYALVFWLAIFATQSQPPDFQSALKVKAIGHQWWFEFQYPELGITTANELHVQKGQTVYFDLESADVIHSFWFPQQGGKRDMIPGHTNHMWFTPETAGRFLGQCVEFCGASHANMRMILYVHEPADFAAWTRTQKEPATAPAPGSPAAAGSQLFIQKGCAGCHTVEGVPAAVGKQGPNLSHYGNRSTVAAGVAENNAENLGRWLRDPPGFKPGALMPNLGLNDDEIAALTAYLHSLK